MEQSEEIYGKGDEYAKRMLVRNRGQAQSPDGYLKGLRRRLSIMEAINKENITRTMDMTNESNPFEKEFSNMSLSEERRMSARLYPDLSDQLNVSQSSSEDPLEDSPLPPPPLPKTPAPLPDANSNDIDYRLSDQFRQDSVLEAAERESLASPFKFGYYVPKNNNNSRLSLGEYFGTRVQNVVDESHHIKEIERDDLYVSRRRESDMFFGARVLEILEPEVVQVERQQSIEPSSSSRRRASEITYLQDNFDALNLPSSPHDDSVTMSIVSEELRQLDRDIQQLDPQQHTDLDAETPKGIYQGQIQANPGTRLSDNFTPKKLFHAACRQPSAVTPAMTMTPDESERQASRDEDTFMTPMPLTQSQVNQLDQRNNLPGTKRWPAAKQPSKQDEESTSPVMSFLKRNTSFLFNNLRVPKMRRKPNLESTRKVLPGNSGDTLGSSLTPGSHVGCTISTLTLPNTTVSPNAYSRYETPSTNACSPYENALAPAADKFDATIPTEVENFLELALGDERYNTTTMTHDMRDRTSSRINDSQVTSEDRSPMMVQPISEPVRHRRTTLNRTLTMYKTLTQRIRKRLQGSVKVKRSEADEDEGEEVSKVANFISPSLRESVGKLLGKVEIEQTLIYQASKALELCNSMREFMTSPERVESERLLVLASLRKKAYVEEIGRLTSPRTDRSLYCERARVTLTNFSLQLRDQMVRRRRHEHNTGPDTVEWFMLVVSEGSSVWASQPVACLTCGTRLHFPGELSLAELTPDFRIRINVYSLQLQQILFNHEDKYHIARPFGPSKSSCPSPKKLLKKKHERWPSIRKQNPDHHISIPDIKKSSFAVCASLELTLHDLKLRSPWPLSGVASKSVLQGTIDLSLGCSLQLSVSHAGFLTHGDEAGGYAVWNRRWCVLDGHQLLFWNYPREQEHKPPLYVIELANCASRRVGPVERRLCAKPRTLLIETVRGRHEIDCDSIVVECRSSYTLVRNFLACDSNQDLTEWQSKLNHVVSALREWNIMNTCLGSS